MRSNELSVTIRRADQNESTIIAKLIDETLADETTVSPIHGNVTDLAGEFFVLDNDSGDLIGVIHVDAGQERGMAGLLTVSADYPENEDVKRRLIAVAEAYCEAQGCQSIELKVISQRRNLSGWCLSMGYEECGTTGSYQPQFSSKPQVEWICMEKHLAA